MKKWLIKENENIADILIEIYGKDKKEFFQNILQAFTAVITDFEKLKLKEKLSFRIKGESFSDLVFNFIEKLIYLKDVKGLLFKEGKFYFEKNNCLILKVDLLGEKISERLPVKIDIKAVTQHKFRVEKNHIYKATIVFDI